MSVATELAKRMPMAGPISASFSPLFPEERALGPLLERAAALIAEGYRLGGQASPPLRESLAGLLRAMNSYYTNKIEGQQTLPADIERAVRSQFDADRERARRQRGGAPHRGSAPAGWCVTPTG